MKKIFSLLAMAMLLGTLALGMAFASEPQTGEEEDLSLYVFGVEVTEENASDVMGNGKVSYDFNTKTLTIDSVTWEATSGNNMDSAIDSEDDLTIVIKGAVSITADDGINCEGNLVVKGYDENASLAIKAVDGNGIIFCEEKNNCTLEGLEISVVSYHEGIASSDGVRNPGSLIITECKITLDNLKERYEYGGIYNFEDVTILDSTVKIVSLDDAGINIDGILFMSNSEVDIESADGISAENVEITDSEVKITSDDDAGICTEKKITIQDSKVTVEAYASALKCPFGLDISGSEVNLTSSGGNGIYAFPGSGDVIEPLALMDDEDDEVLSDDAPETDEIYGILNISDSTVTIEALGNGISGYSLCVSDDSEVTITSEAGMGIAVVGGMMAVTDVDDEMPESVDDLETALLVSDSKLSVTAEEFSLIAGKAEIISSEVDIDGVGYEGFLLQITDSDVTINGTEVGISEATSVEIEYSDVTVSGDGAAFEEPEKVTLTKAKVTEGTLEECVKKVVISRVSTVQWLDEDGNVLWEQEDVVGDEEPEYGGEEPTKEETETATYTFTGWKQIESEEVGLILFEAEFEETLKEVEEEPSDETEEPSSETEEPSDETEEPSNETEESSQETVEPSEESNASETPDSGEKNDTANANTADSVSVAVLAILAVLALGSVCVAAKFSRR